MVDSGNPEAGDPSQVWQGCGKCSECSVTILPGQRHGLLDPRNPMAALISSLGTSFKVPGVTRHGSGARDQVPRAPGGGGVAEVSELKNAD